MGNERVVFFEPPAVVIYGTAQGISQTDAGFCAAAANLTQDVLHVRVNLFEIGPLVASGGQG